MISSLAVTSIVVYYGIPHVFNIRLDGKMVVD